MVFGKKKSQRVKFEQNPQDEVVEEEELYEEEEIPQLPKLPKIKKLVTPQFQPQVEPEPPPQLGNWIVHDAPTETQRVIVNTQSKKVYDLYSAIVECLNKQDQILYLARE